MVERFAYWAGTLSVANGAETVTGTGTAWGGHDREGAQIWYRPPGSPAADMKLIGIVGAVDPRGIYEHTSLPLAFPYTGESLVDANYLLLDGPAIANGVTQAAIYARFVAFLETKMGLVGNTADDPDYDLAQENTLFVDAVSRVIYQWRNGVLVQVHAIGLTFSPKGEFDIEATYEKNDLVSYNGYIFVSNIDENLGNTPGGSPFPSSDSNWTHMPMPGVSDVLEALGVNSITVSEDDPSGGVNNDLWIKV